MKIYEIEMESIDNLDYAEWNYKKEATDEENRKFANSLLRNGFNYGLIVAQRLEKPDDNKWEVIDGNHRLRILREMKLVQVPVYKIGRLSLTDRMRISIEVNEWSFEINSIALTDCFSKFTESSEELSNTMPLSSEEIDKLRNLYNYDPNGFKLPPDDFDDGELNIMIDVDFTELQYATVMEAFTHYSREKKVEIQDMVMDFVNEKMKEVK